MKINQKVFFLLGAVVILIGIGYYLLPNKKMSSEPNYFEFTVYNKDLPQESIDKFTDRFLDAKNRIIQDEDDLEAWILLGSTKKQVGDYVGAEAAWIKAGEIRPLNSKSFNNLADLYTNFMQDYPKAEEAWFKAVENSKGESINSAFYRNFHYFYYYNLKDYTKAENILLEAINTNPTASDLTATLGYFYKDQGDTEKAIEYFKKTLELNPDNEQVKNDLSGLE